MNNNSNLLNWVLCKDLKYFHQKGDRGYFYSLGLYCFPSAMRKFHKLYLLCQPLTPRLTADSFLTGHVNKLTSPLHRHGATQVPFPLLLLLSSPSFFSVIVAVLDFSAFCFFLSPFPPPPPPLLFGFFQKEIII